MTTVQAPAKLIISGEHAVVYGRPALAVAVAPGVTARVAAHEAAGEVVFSMPAYGLEKRVYTRDLAAFVGAKTAAWAAFAAGRCPITAVLDGAWELLPMAYGLGLDGAAPPEGTRLHLESGVPVGCGMGTSAALGLAVIRAAAAVAGLEVDHDQLYGRSLSCERCLHGYPSGVDSCLCLEGGSIRFQEETLTPRPLPDTDLRLLLTGRPASTTGECVMHVRERFADSAIWDEFAAVTEAVDRALDHAPADLPALVRENHRLLCRIGVVPERVQALIAELEAAGAGAKVCGAGSVAGDQAGVVLVCGAVDLDAFAAAHGLRTLRCTPQAEGLRLTQAEP